jgi:predicted porin
MKTLHMTSRASRLLRRPLLLAIGAVAPVSVSLSAAAAEPIKLGVGGFFREAYQVVLDDDEEGEPGNERNTDGFFNDAEIHFVGSTVLDNGLEVGARIELEGEADDDQIDEAWVWFSGGWGELRIGSDDDALANACIMPPGGTTNFSAFSPNQWGANNGGDNSACFGATGLLGTADAQKVLYISPVLGGFQLTTSYTPDSDVETHLDGAGPHLGMTAKPLAQADYIAAAYLTYQYDGADWGVTWGGGGSFQADFDEVNGTDIFSQDFYQTGLNLRFGNWSVGGVFEYFNDAFSAESDGGEDRLDLEGWRAGGGIAYAHDAWTFGAQYSYGHSDFEREDDDDDFDNQIDTQRIVATVNYALGPGIAVDAEVGYTWADTDPEEAETFIGDDYDGLEFGIGTVITF